MPDKGNKITLEELARMMNENFVTKTELSGGLDRISADMQQLRLDVRSDMEELLEKLLKSYMDRYDELAHRVKRIEEHIGIDR